MARNTRDVFGIRENGGNAVCVEGEGGHLTSRKPHSVHCQHPPFDPDLLGVSVPEQSICINLCGHLNEDGSMAPRA